MGAEAFGMAVLKKKTLPQLTATRAWRTPDQPRTGCRCRCRYCLTSLPEASMLQQQLAREFVSHHKLDPTGHPHRPNGCIAGMRF